ncbi:hypothetical protein ACFLXB_05410 [Chloroflexota bacterium]
MYQWILLIHILGAFVFAFFHGASTKVIFRLRRESDPDRMAALLDLSSDHLGLMYISLLVMLAGGIGVGYFGDWFLSIWIWLSLALLVVIVAAMYYMATKPLNRVRITLGLPHNGKNDPRAAGETANPEEIAASIKMLKPWLMTAIGYGGLLLILVLMVLKPF